MPQYYRKLSKGIRWLYKFDLAGKTYRSQAIYHSKSEAKRAEAEKYKELDERRRFPNLKEDKKLSELINARLNEVKTKKSNKYYKANKKYLEELVTALGDMWVSDITRGDINSFITETAQNFKLRGKANYAPNAMLRAYKALFNFGIDNYNFSVNPCKGIKLFSIDKHLKYIPTDKEIEDIRALCDWEQKLLIDFVKETGARINEALRLAGKDILEDELVLYTRKSKNSNLTPRKVPTPQCLIGKRYNRDQKVFGRWTEQPKFLDRKLRFLRKTDATIKLWGWHNLRHRYASKLSKAGEPIFNIMAKLGHSNISTTQIYLQYLA